MNRIVCPLYGIALFLPTIIKDLPTIHILLEKFVIARSALAIPKSGHTDEARLEPVFTELIAAHTRRMDALGLTA